PLPPTPPQDPEGFPKAMTVSALQEDGLEAAWAEMQALTDWRRDQGHWDRNRAAQARFWFAEEVRQALLARLETPQARDRMDRLAQAVAEGRATPTAAAQEMLASLDPA
ncbi:methylmalonyl Co-A mutase-associated GTPase MeaB, partial [Cribrihabitans sp. XS_ASV171]